MDAYSIGAAVKAAVPAANVIGLTAHMLYSVQDGDRIVTCSNEEAMDFRRDIDARKLKDVQIAVVEPKNFFALDKHGPVAGRTHFSPKWVVQYYENSVQRAADDLAFYQTRLSGKP